MDGVMADNEILRSWSERLARRIAPDEIHTAAHVALAYAAGGTRQRELFAATVALPAVLQALDACAPTVRAFLARDRAAFGEATAGLLVALRQRHPRRSPACGEETAPAEAVEQATGSVEALRGRLRESAATAERAEAIAGLVLAELARDPAGAGAFLTQLRSGMPGHRGSGRPPS
jgi:hypothetical protein